MPDPNAGMNESFQRFAILLEKFADSIGGAHSSHRGIDEREIKSSKSSLSVWADERIVYPLLSLFGQDTAHESLMEQFDQLYSNVYVTCTYQGWLIRFHARNVGFGYSEAGKLGLIVRCEVSARSNFSLSVHSDDNTVSADKGVTWGKVPGFMHALIPTGALNALERAPETMFPIDFDSTELGSKYSGATSVVGLSEKILQNSGIVRCLAKLPNVHWLNAGYFDWRFGTDTALVELEESVDASLEQLEESLSLMKHMLDALDAAGLIGAVEG